MATEAVKGDDTKSVHSGAPSSHRRGSRGSLKVGEDVRRGSFTVRKSVQVPALAVVGKVIQDLRQECEEDDLDDEDAPYREVVSEARQVLGGCKPFKAFHEEWDAQLLIRCADTFAGYRVVLFCPFFLRPVMEDPDEMDRAFRFIMLSMDEIAMQRKYIFVYCYLGMDWSNPSLASRLRFAYDILPRRYATNLKAFYVLHPSGTFRMTMWTFRPLISSEFWDKIEYINSLDEICELLHPTDENRRADLKRRFPIAVHRQDAELAGQSKPVAFGVPLRQISWYYGVDFVDKTTGKWYPRLPPSIIFLCESLEREAGEEDFSVFSAKAEDVYRMVEIIDEGRPLERDMSPASMWCVLKLWVDCLPSPLLSFQAIEELKQKQIRAGDIAAQRSFLINLFHNHLSPESAYVALYLSSFLHSMCQNAIERQDTGLLQSSAPVNRSPMQETAKKTPITPSLAAQVFTSSFIRPRIMTEEMHEVIPHAVSLVETLVTCAEEPELWIGRREPAPQAAPNDDEDSSSDDFNLFLASSMVTEDKPEEPASSSAVAAASAEAVAGDSSSDAAASASSAAAAAEEGAHDPSQEPWEWSA